MLSPFSQIGLDSSLFEAPSTIPAEAFENMPVPQTPWESFTSGLGSFFDSLSAGSSGHRGMDKLPEEAQPSSGGGFWDALSRGGKVGPR